MTYYKSKRFVDRLKWIIVDEDGKIVNINPSKDELRGLEREQKDNYKRNVRKDYTDKQLLDYLIQFYEKYGRPPKREDFNGNPEYPYYRTYTDRFGSWQDALKLVGLDFESMVKKGIIETKEQKGRFGEMIIRDHFESNSVDLAGENCRSPCDGICPNGKTYEVKSSKSYLYSYGKFWAFGTDNKHKDEIEIYYFLAFNEDYTELIYAWRVPGEIVDCSMFHIGQSNSNHKFNIENMKQYDITEKLREVLMKYGYFEKIKNYIKAREKGLTIYEYDKQLYDGYIVAE